VTSTAVASLSLVKTASPSTVSAAGQRVVFTYTVENDGQQSVRFDGSITETSFTGDGSAPSVRCRNAPIVLGPGESTVCVSRGYVVRQADIDAGGLSNTAVAGGVAAVDGPIQSPPDTAEVTSDAAPLLTLTKTASPSTVSKAGTVITYSYAVQNTGAASATFEGVDEVAFTGSGGTPAVSCPDEGAVLAPGAQTWCTAHYTVTQADIDAGGFDNTAVVRGSTARNGSLTSDRSSAPVTADRRPGLSLVKSASVSAFRAGEKVAYTFVVTNTGNVTIRGIKINEGVFSGAGPAPKVRCQAGAAALAPGAQVICAATYTLTGTDIAAGRLSNSATAVGSAPSGDKVAAVMAKVVLPQQARPALELVKTGTALGVSAAGATIEYTLTVTNTGNVKLTGVAVREGAFSGSGAAPSIDCPAGADTLLPGQRITCVAVYSATAADIAAGKIRNTATATGVAPNGVRVTSESTAVVAFDRLPLTGAAALTHALAAVSLLLLGAALLTIARRRQPS
ncbi:MAG: hypothetical protein FWD74_09455, partial [Actinomycetia bacterium]|nr:hypothetical protein [Actinomycetes bacterium]